MKKRDTWHSFMESGKVSDYLVYRQSLQEKQRQARGEKSGVFLENK